MEGMAEGLRKKQKLPQKVLMIKYHYQLFTHSLTPLLFLSISILSSIILFSSDLKSSTHFSCFSHLQKCSYRVHLRARTLQERTDHPDSSQQQQYSPGTSLLVNLNYSPLR
jgi:hypothetical protein